MSYKINIKNSYNIKELDFTLKRNTRNLIVANNGTGKSSFVKSIDNKLNGTIDIGQSFIFENHSPEINIQGKLNNIMIFDESFAGDIIFQNNELLGKPNSYELLLENERFRKNKKIINETLGEFNAKVAEISNNIEKDLKKYNTIYNKTNRYKNKKEFFPTKTYSSLKDDNPFRLKNKLGKFYNVLRHTEEKVKWFKWRKSQEAIAIDDLTICPYCTQGMSENLNLSLKKTIEGLNEKSADTREKLQNLTNNLKEHLSLNFDVVERIVNTNASINSKTNNLQLFNLFSKITNVLDTLQKCKNLSNEHHYNDYKMFDFNAIKINRLKPLKEFNELEILFNQIRSESRKLDGISKTLDKQLNKAIENKTNILNKFCNSTGIPYDFNYIKTNNLNKIIMTYKNKNDEIDKPLHRLRFGEKNAISSIIFGLMVQEQNPDMVILDDPFSSFDEHKKFFIYESFFRKDELLKGKTVLYLTHEHEALIDLMYLGVPTRFCNSYFMSNKNGVVKMNRVKRSDISSFKYYLINKINQSDNEIIKFAYIRKLLKLIEKISAVGRFNKSKEKDGVIIEYENFFFLYNYISSHLKGTVPQTKIDNEYLKMDKDEIEASKSQLKQIKEKYNISEFETTFDSTDMKSVIKEIDSLENVEQKLIFMRYLLWRDYHNENKLNHNKTDISSYFVNIVNHFEKDKLMGINSINYTSIPTYVNDIVQDYYDKLIEVY